MTIEEDIAAAAADIAAEISAGAPVLRLVREPPESVAFIDWEAFWAKDRRGNDWLLDDVLARGRGHSIYAGHKIGKSLFLLWASTELLKDPTLVVVYFDYEMGEDDLYDRLVEMGHEGKPFERFRYALLPTLPPLDSADGARALFTSLDAVQTQWPECHLMVVIDTTGRAVAGEENSADTIRDFYRHSGIGLKQRGVTWVRLDHAGKDPGKGQRGTSAKGDDVDIVWKLERTDDGIALKREAARMGWVPEKVCFARREDPFEYVRTDYAYPAGTKEAAELLDALGVPVDAGHRVAGNALRDAGKGKRQIVVLGAVKWRRERDGGMD